MFAIDYTIKVLITLFAQILPLPETLPTETPTSSLLTAHCSLLTAHCSSPYRPAEPP